MDKLEQRIYLDQDMKQILRFKHAVNAVEFDLKQQKDEEAKNLPPGYYIDLDTPVLEILKKVALEMENRRKYELTRCKCGKVCKI